MIASKGKGRPVVMKKKRKSKGRTPAQGPDKEGEETRQERATREVRKYKAKDRTKSKNVESIKSQDASKKHRTEIHRGEMKHHKGRVSHPAEMGKWARLVTGRVRKAIHSKREGLVGTPRPKGRHRRRKGRFKDIYTTPTYEGKM